MTVTPYVYGLATQSLFNKEVDWDTDNIKVMLCTSAYAPNADTHRYKSSVTNEVVGTGYVAGGATLASKTITYDTATNKLTLDCADVSWAPSTITARFAVFYASTGTDATSPLLLYWDFGIDEATYNSTFSLTIPLAGLVTLTAS